MTIRHLYPAVEPSLNLDFANSKRLDSRITFTRGSTATYTDESGIIRTAAANEARFDHDSDGNSLGLLVEESRTNLETYSEVFTDSSWAKTDSSVNPNAIVSPDGLSNGTKLVENTNNAVHGVYKNYGSILTSGVKYTHTVFAKAGERSTLQLSSSQGSDYANFDLLNGTITYSTAGSNASIVALPNGWYKCSSQFTPSSVALVRPFILVYNTSNPTRTSSYVGDGTSGIYLWGAQLEAGAFPTSYIPTAGATATRAADVASMTGTNFSNWWNSSASTFLVTGKVSSGRTQADNQGAAYLSTGQGSSRLLYVNLNEIATYDGTNKTWVYVSDQSQTHKMAVAFTTTNQYLVVDGGAAVTGAYNNLYNSASSIFIGKGVKQLGGTIARLAYYPVRLPDATLQALTL